MLSPGKGWLAILTLILGNDIAESRSYFDTAIGPCPWGWEEAGRLCYRFVDDEKKFGDALQHCHDMRAHSFPDNPFYEDESAMLTTNDLHAIKREYVELHKFVWRQIWLNGLKGDDGTIYSFHKLPRDSNLDDALEILSHPDTSAQAIAAPESTILFPDFDSSAIPNQHALLLDPGWHDRDPSLKSDHHSDERHKSVCVHKRIRNDRYACPGSKTECNNNGACLSGHCVCFPNFRFSDGICKPPCPPGFETFGTRCLIRSSFIDDGLWIKSVAMQWCADRGAKIVEPQSLADEQALAALLPTTGALRDNNFWLGIILGDEVIGSDNWVYQSNGEPVPYRNWGPGEPFATPGSDSVDFCVHVFQQGAGNSLWNDIACDTGNAIFGGIAFCELIE